MGSIVWLASYPRSGNTWTRSFLHNLINILRGNPEAPEVNDEQDINAMDSLTTWDVRGYWWMEELQGRSLKDIPKEELAAIRPKIQARIAEAASGVVFVKTHNALVLNRGHPTLNFQVTSGAIYVVRNPLDSVISNAHHFGIPVEVAVERMNTDGLETEPSKHSSFEYYGSWWQNVESWTRKPHRSIYVMRYEDMLKTPKETFGALARHLLLNPTDTQLSEAIEKSSFERLKKQEAQKGFIERPKQSESFFREGKAEQWREALTRNQIRAIIRHNRAMMEKFDYIPEGF